MYAGVGVRRVPVVSKCECVGGCHRLPHCEEVTVYGEGGSQRQGEEEELGSGVVLYSLPPVLLVGMLLCVTTSMDSDLSPSLTSSNTFPVSGTNCCMRIPNNAHIGLSM